MTKYIACHDPNPSAAGRTSDLLARTTPEKKAAQSAAPFGAVVDVHNPPSAPCSNITTALSTMNTPSRTTARAANELQRKHVEDARLGTPVVTVEEALPGLVVRESTVFPSAIAQAETRQRATRSCRYTGRTSSHRITLEPQSSARVSVAPGAVRLFVGGSPEAIGWVSDVRLSGVGPHIGLGRALSSSASVNLHDEE